MGRTIVVTGGTDGLGRAVVLDRLGHGDRVVVVGGDGTEGEGLRGEARRLRALGRLTLLEADLSLVAENRRVVRELVRAHPSLDALVLCAHSVSARREVTAEGFERTFALLYLSRYLLVHGLRDVLGRGERPLVVDVAAPGAVLDLVRWDDLQLGHGYDAERASAQAGKLNDLLGVAFAAEKEAPAVGYVLADPDSAPDVIRDLLEEPPAAPLTALAGGRPLDVEDHAFDPWSAGLLESVTQALLDHGGHTP